MSDKTAISWAEATWNPVVGCTRTSLDCDHPWDQLHLPLNAPSPVSPLTATGTTNPEAMP